MTSSLSSRLHVSLKSGAFRGLIGVQTLVPLKVYFECAIGPVSAGGPFGLRVMKNFLRHTRIFFSPCKRSSSPRKVGRKSRVRELHRVQFYTYDLSVIHYSTFENVAGATEYYNARVHHVACNTCKNLFQ